MQRTDTTTPDTAGRRGIVLTGEEARALLDKGEVTIARTMKHQPHPWKADGIWAIGVGRGRWTTNERHAVITDKKTGKSEERDYLEPFDTWILEQSPYQPGEQFYVREGFKVEPTAGLSFGEFMMGSAHTITYRADNAEQKIRGCSEVGSGFCSDYGSDASDYPIGLFGMWRSPMSMPVWAVRTVVTVAAVRAAHSEAGTWQWLHHLTRVQPQREKK